MKLKPAFCILLRMYEKASETFRGAQQVVQVHLGKLVEIVGDSFGILDIADLPFEIVKRGDYEGEVLLENTKRTTRERTKQPTRLLIFAQQCLQFTAEAV